MGQRPENDWNQVPLKEIKSGEIVWECDGGECIELEVTATPYENHWGWNIPVRTMSGEATFGHMHGYQHYGPKLYRRPVYSRVTKLDGTIVNVWELSNDEQDDMEIR